MNPVLQQFAIVAVDAAYAIVPRRTPARERLAKCRLVAHRGAWNGTDRLENTLAAFDLAAARGVWGIEFDIRWTGDLVPVVIHDATGARIFGNSTPIRSLTLPELRERMPLVPTLQQVVERYGKRMHLMIEIKREPYPEPARQASILEKVLAPLTAGDDYHFLALEPDLFDLVPFADRSICCPVAELEIRRISREVLDSDLGGIMGHYLLLTRRMQARHEALGQKIATGFVASRSVLFREIERGAEWICTNDAVKLQQILDEALARDG